MMRYSAAAAQFGFHCSFLFVFAADIMQGYTASQKEDLLVGFAVLALYDGGVEVSVRLCCCDCVL